MSAIAQLDEEDMCSRCGCEPRGVGRRNTWCRRCKSEWQRQYRAGKVRFKPVPSPVPDANGCLVWQGSIAKNGYGRQADGKGNVGYAHRRAWEAVNGPIPAGLTIDHLCFNRACVNVAHMEVVTRAENTRRARRTTGHTRRKVMA